MTKHRTRFGSFIALLLLFGSSLAILVWPNIQTLWYEFRKPPELPPAQSANALTDHSTNASKEPLTPTADPSPATTPTLPRELNLAVPFTAQAPFANWDSAHEEYCEEASVLMAARFFTNEPIKGPTDADAELFRLHQWQLEHLGHFESTTAEETARIAREVYGLSPFLSSDVTADTIKRSLASGNLVILPAAGRKLGNPYFQRPGPVYHMLVVKGYTSDGRFITNDPGTRHGADFVYDAEVLLNAVGDYNGGAPDRGEKRMLVISRPQD